MALALKLRDLDEDAFASSPTSAKRCSGCDPDVPGACPPQRCLRCRGTMLEPLSFQATVSQLAQSRREAESEGNKPRGRRFSVSQDYDADGDDDVQDLEY